VVVEKFEATRSDEQKSRREKCRNGLSGAAEFGSGEVLRAARLFGCGEGGN
jgi:hypothetical protein